MDVDLRALAEAATPGPWHVDGPEFGGMWVVTGAPMPADSFAVHPHAKAQEYAVLAGQGGEDAAYIAAASPDRIALLDVVDAARAVLEWSSSEHKDGKVDLPAPWMRTLKAAVGALR